jgi:F0F1-type ATP synthase assembly protein I
MPPNQQPDFSYASVMTTVVGQVGCLTVFIIGLGLGAGMLVDRLVGTDGIFAGIFILASIPTSLFLVMRVSLRAIARLQETQLKEKKDAKHEDSASS